MTMADTAPYITITKGGAGWFAVYMWWAPEHGGYWEPWQTGIGRYATPAEAEKEGREWADAEELKYVPQTAP
jgi:hypothetical protein